jgi:GNAT superfamily N-acetyltransferase
MALSSSQRPSKIAIRPFDPNVELNRFGCGQDIIDRWLRNDAKKRHRRDEERVFLGFTEGYHFPIAYYSLKIGYERTAELAQQPNDWRKNHAIFVSVHLSFLGVDRAYQGQGVGTYMMGDVIQKAHAISTMAAFSALTLQSLDQASTKFYEKLGFVPYTTNPSAPKMLLPIEIIRNLVVGNPTPLPPDVEPIDNAVQPDKAPTWWQRVYRRGS